MDTYSLVVARLREAVAAAVNKAIEKGELPQAELPDFIIETPADNKNGDFATNAAMAGAKSFRMPPFKIAKAVTDNLDLSGTFCDRFETAGPGFINFFLGAEFYAEVIKNILSDPEGYGSSDFGQGEKVNVEFVSANPTGPMHMGNARGGALGDCLAAVLSKAGYDAYREFYVNDAGNQIEKFACSLEARYLQIYKGDEIVFPEDGYQGADIIELAQEFADINGDSYVEKDSAERKKALVDYALPKNIKKMQEDMATYKITYDKVVTEKLLKEGKSQQYIDNLELKDDVLIRKNGNPTYFAVDIAYHKNKFDRGFTTLIDIWGADHHGHVMRMKGAMDAIGCSGDDLTIVLMQLVNLVRDGKPVKMSKRTGKAIQLRDLLEEVPVDSARFLFNTREANTQMDFDLDLAVAQDNQNPVYYVQYAHARICSIFKALAADGITLRKCSDSELKLLAAPEEKELISLLSLYTSEVISAAKAYDPTRVTRYVTSVATLFHKFYNACRVKGEDEGLMQARLALCDCARAVIKNVLTMFNINCPDSM